MSILSRCPVKRCKKATIVMCRVPRLMGALEIGIMSTFQTKKSNPFPDWIGLRVRKANSQEVLLWLESRGLSQETKSASTKDLQQKDATDIG